MGLSWQIIPQALPRGFPAGGAVAEQVFAEMMQMQKIDVEAMEAAMQGVIFRRKIAHRGG
ncbi:MAG: hypothetical protein WCO04_00240 [Pseudomonadota bacterium]